jgi:hypothetical protein
LEGIGVDDNDDDDHHHNHNNHLAANMKLGQFLTRWDLTRLEASEWAPLISSACSFVIIEDNIKINLKAIEWVCVD